MNDYDQLTPPPDEPETDGPLRERLRSDDSTDEPVSEEALVDADAIGTGLRDEGEHAR